MENEKKSLSPVVAGLMISLVLVILTMLFSYAGLQSQSWVQWVGYAVIIIGICWSVMHFSGQESHRFGFGDLFAYGFRLTTVIICIMIVFTLLFSYMNPEMKEQVMEATREKFSSQPGISDSDADRFLALFEKNYTLILLIGVIFSYLMLGVLGSLLGAALAKKKPSSPFDSTDKQP